MIIWPVGRLVRHNRGPAHRGGCTADFGSGTLVPGGMDWRSLSGLPGGLGICSHGIVMQLLSGSSESWSTGGCVATHGQEVARRQWFTDRDLGMFVLCGVFPGAPDGVSHSGVQSEHRCYYWDGYVGINTATYPGYQERTAVYIVRCIPSTAPPGRCIVGPRLHGGTAHGQHRWCW